MTLWPAVTTRVTFVFPESSAMSVATVGAMLFWSAGLKATLPGFGYFVICAGTDECLLQADNVIVMFWLALWEIVHFPYLVESVAVPVN